MALDHRFNYLSTDYLEYQKRYATKIRESDKILIDMVNNCLSELEKEIKLLDIGASTGNFLLHLKKLFPNLKLVGSEIIPSVVDSANKNPDLADIPFKLIDILQETDSDSYDIVVANALLHFFSPEEVKKCFLNISQLTKKGGFVMGFAWLNSYEQTLITKEISPQHPKGVAANCHSIADVTKALEIAGFSEYKFFNFDINTDLPESPSKSTLNSYTKKLDNGKNLLFRGSICQPWQHFIAKKI